MMAVDRNGPKNMLTQVGRSRATDVALTLHQVGLARLFIQCCFTNCYCIITCSAAKMVMDLFWTSVLCKNLRLSPDVNATVTFAVVLR